MTTRNHWNALDIGKASTEVRIGPYWRTTEGGTTAYQEVWLSESLDAAAPGEDSRIHAADRYRDTWNATTNRWRSVPQLNAVALQPNLEPGAPKQTFVFGRMGKNNSTVPDMYVPDEWGCPLDGQYTTSPEGTTTAGDGASGPVGPTYPPRPPSTNDNANELSPTEYMRQMQQQHNNVPYIPRMYDKVPNSKSLRSDYKYAVKTTQGYDAIPTWNIWKQMPIQNTDTGERYIPNYGPDWSSVDYRGSQVRQAGGERGYRVQVLATQSAARVQRRFPLWMDVGRALPWLFTYVDDEGYVCGEIVPPTACEGPPVANGGAFTACPNVGFVMNLDISAESPQGSAFASGGGNGRVSVKWGKMRASGGFIEGAMICFSQNEPVKLYYDDGEKIVSLQLTPYAIFSTTVTLIVEYFGTSMLVRVGDFERLVQGRRDNGKDSDLHGFNVLESSEDKNGNIEVLCHNCCLIFDCSPVYYNGWDPGQVVIKTETPSDADAEFADYQFGGRTALDRDKWVWKYGRSKLVGMGVVACVGGDDGDDAGKRAKEVVSQVIESIEARTYSFEEIRAGRMPNSQTLEEEQDNGHPCVWKDPRMIGGKPVEVVASRVILDYPDEEPRKYLDKHPNDNVVFKQGITAIDLMLVANTTYTTPLVFGVKLIPNVTHEEHNDLQNFSDYVSGWTVNWAVEDEDNPKFMKATAQVKLLNPPEWLKAAVRQNQLLIQISNSGYINLANAVRELNPENTDLQKSAFASQVFRGFIVKTRTQRQASGEQEMTLECEDMTLMLQRAIFETNVRYDGMNYLGAFVLAMLATDYGDMLVLRAGGKDYYAKTLPQPYWFGLLGRQGGNPVGKHSALSVYCNMYFGYQAGVGNAYHVRAGSPVLPQLLNIINAMHNPRYYPLFFYDPSARQGKGGYVLTFREVLGGKSSARILGPPFSKQDLISGLPMIGDSALVTTSDTGGMRSHITVVGQDRFTTLMESTTGESRSWNSLSVKKDKKTWKDSAGHLGYRAKLIIVDEKGMFPDRRVREQVTNDKAWWLLSPKIMFEGMTVHGVVGPVGNSGLISVRDDVWEHDRTYLLSSTISYDGDEHELTSEVRANYLKGMTADNAV